jgi:hypothetical protein
MTRSTKSRGVAVAAVLGTVLVGCAAPVNEMTPRPPVDIAVTATGCATEHMTLAVDPWEARVRSRQAVRWSVPADVDSMRVVPKNGWPFPARPPVGAPRGWIQAGTILATTPVGQRYPYSVLLYCDGRVIDIDPIIIRDPD